jgi:PRTRC genetic system protein B
MSSSINAMLQNHYQPTMALILYQEVNPESDRLEGGRESGAHNYFEVHQINEEGQMLEGKPLQAETLAGIAKVYHEQEKQHAYTGIFPECLLYFKPAQKNGKYEMLWYRPADRQMLHFKEELNIPDGMAPVPAMLWRVSNRKLQVYALAGNERPDEATKLFHAPFHNVGAEGEVCLGSARTAKPEKTYESQIKYWESLFWNSKFTHLNNGKIVKGNLNLIWKQLIKSRNPKSWAELDVLLPSIKTIKNLLK